MMVAWFLPGTVVHGDQGQPSMRYLALGDSYTIGESVAATERGRYG